MRAKYFFDSALVRSLSHCLALFSAIILIGTGCATEEGPVISGAAGTSNQEPLKYPVTAGTAAYWGNGRINVTMNNLYDEERQQNTCLMDQMYCFRAEGQKVYGWNKKAFIVVNLEDFSSVTRDFTTEFPLEDQQVLRKLTKKTKGNIYFDEKTLGPIKY